MNLQKNFDEIDLMFSCCRVEMQDCAKHHIEEILSKPINWDFLIKQSIYHDIAPLVYHNLRKINCSAIPDKVLSKFKKHYLCTLMNNRYFWSECCYLLKTFRNLGIKVVPLKGIIFAHIIYHDLGLRPMADIDILVQEKDLPEVERILLQLNYKKHLAEYPEEFRRRYSYHSVYSKQITPGSVLPVEVHWNFTRPSAVRVFFPNIWSRVKKDIVDQQEVLLLSAEDALLQLCLQIKWHFPRRLILVCDVSELLKQHRADLDWSYLIKEAKDNRVQFVLYFTLLFIKRLLGNPVPEDWLKRLQPGLIRRSLIRAYISNKKWFFQNRRGILARIRMILLHLLLSERRKDFIIYILSMPIEEFAQLYSLPLNSRRTLFLYCIRYLYIPFNF